MKHVEVQSKLILYIDGELTEKQMKEISTHLSACSNCVRQLNLLESVWKSKNLRQKELPSPFLWTRLQARIKENEQTPIFVWDLKRILQGITLRPFPALAIIAAVVVGIYLGSPLEPQRYKPVQSVSQLVGAADELGLDQFDVIPPGTLGSTLVNISNRQR